MNLKLQQAILAVRKGRPETAQAILTDLIQENPAEADAWFLLSYLVETSERQARYLQQALMIDPDHTLAQSHLERLLAPGVPAPVIKGSQEAKGAGSQTTAVSQAPVEEPRTPPSTQLPEWLQDLDQKPLGSTTAPRATVDDWRLNAGAPKRETRPVPPQPVPSTPTTLTPPVTTSSSEPAEEAGPNMLLIILLILITLSLFVLAYLVVQIFFS